jgi:EAL domain-containing protein (putative c-di-GMP-specific phosphodiesterase class I)
VVAVRIGAGQLKAAADLAGDINATLAECGVATPSIELELTETVLMQATQKYQATLDRLRDFGFRLAVDDFGSGYSSLCVLADYPVSRLKIASGLVAGIVRSDRSAAVVSATVQLAQQLGVEVLADGVDSQAQATFLLAAGCTQGQGLLFGAPLSANDAALLLKRASRDAAATTQSSFKSSAA